MFLPLVRLVLSLLTLVVRPSPRHDIFVTFCIVQWTLANLVEQYLLRFFFWIQRLPFVRKFLFLYRVIHNSTLLHSAHFKDSLYGSVFSRSALFNALVLFTLAFFSIEY